MEDGISNVNENIFPIVNETLSATVLPRVRISYAVLIWFVIKLGNYTLDVLL